LDKAGIWLLFILLDCDKLDIDGYDSALGIRTSALDVVVVVVVVVVGVGVVVVLFSEFIAFVSRCNK